MPSLHRNIRLSRKTVWTGASTVALSLSFLLLSGCGSGGGINGTVQPIPTLADFTSSVNLGSGDTTVYTDTYSNTFSPDPYNQSVKNATKTLTDAGTTAYATDLIPDGGASLGTPTSATLSLPKSGNVTVTKQAVLDVLGNVEGYEYYTLSGSAETYYGDDTLSRGALSTTTRYDPGVVYPYSLESGQNDTQTYTDYETTYDSSGNVDKSYNYPITASTTFVSILKTYTVTAGTYTDVAQVQYFSSSTVPAGTFGNTNVEALTDTATFYLSPYVGVLEDDDVSTTANELITPTVGGESPYTTTQTVSDDQVLTSATVAGVSYPPGKAATSTRNVGPVRLGHLVHLLRARGR